MTLKNQHPKGGTELQFEYLEKYVDKNYGFKISLLHLDLDTYKGTKSALKYFYPKISRGGIIILDEYASRGWGETQAVDEFIKEKKYKVETLENTDSPTGYIKVI